MFVLLFVDKHQLNLPKCCYRYLQIPSYIFINKNDYIMIHNISNGRDANAFLFVPFKLSHRYSGISA